MINSRKCYCINPQCGQRENLASLNHCPHCGSSLLIADRYRLVQPLRDINPVYPTDVFLVKDWGISQPNWGATKVLKVLKFTHNPDLVRLSQQEARALMFLRHPAIPEAEPDGYFTLRTSNNQFLHCLVMQEIEGENLETWLEENDPLLPMNVVLWWKQLVEILGFLHSKQIVHRDLKVSNIIRQPNDNLAVIDLGSVQLDEQDHIGVGTPGYAAPEQIAGEAVTQSDLFALGRTLVHIITGISPLELPIDEQTDNLIWREQVPASWHTFPPSNQIFDVIDDLMILDLAKRVKNVKEICERMTKIMGNLLD